MWFEDGPPDFYTQVILNTPDHAPLLANPRLARRALDTAIDSAPHAPGRLWGALVLPDALRLVVGPTDTNALDRFVERIKAQTQARLLDVILRLDDDSLDRVLRYNPVWGGAIYRVWAAGYHRADFASEYKLSNALYELRRLPVTAGLVEDAGDWPYTWINDD
ncbi:MAG: hypothetical protein JXJ20_04080 [Anaerolineae bacterium]|nr:hypothetical protein [Anaerolineae bacterium]